VNLAAAARSAARRGARAPVPPTRTRSGGPPAPSDAALARVVRDEAARLSAAVTRLVGNFAVAEEIVGDTLVVALERWRRDGVPPRPGAWLMMVAKRRAIDVLRRDATYLRKLAELALPEEEPPSEADERLRLLFTCCHPGLAPEARIALTLQAILGLTTAEIAAAFLVTPDVVAQRLSRARRKIREAGIPYSTPSSDELPERLPSVLAVLYLAFNEGYLSSRPWSAERRDLATDAAWLTELVVGLLPDEPEPLALLALMRMHLARADARFDATGALVRLRDQDRGLWDGAGLTAAIALLERAATLGRTGPIQLQAAIVACHIEASAWEETDWVQVLLLYDALVRLDPSPVVLLNRAIALAEVLGPDAALGAIDDLPGVLFGYHLYHATRADLLTRLGREAEARLARATAVGCTRNPAERALLGSPSD
jgi:RNA polymerase sigma-70 factor (ECF subfamily)